MTPAARVAWDGHRMRRRVRVYRVRRRLGWPRWAAWRHAGQVMRQQRNRATMHPAPWRPPARVPPPD